MLQVDQTIGAGTDQAVIDKAIYELRSLQIEHRRLSAFRHTLTQEIGYYAREASYLADTPLCRGETPRDRWSRRKFYLDSKKHAEQKLLDTKPRMAELQALVMERGLFQLTLPPGLTREQVIENTLWHWDKYNEARLLRRGNL